MRAKAPEQLQFEPQWLPSWERRVQYRQRWCRLSRCQHPELLQAGILQHSDPLPLSPFQLPVRHLRQKRLKLAFSRLVEFQKPDKIDWIFLTRCSYGYGRFNHAWHIGQCKHIVRWQHLSQIKARLFWLIENVFFLIKTQQVCAATCQLK